MGCGESEELELELDQFATTRWQLQWLRDGEPVNLAGMRLRCQARLDTSSDDPPLFDLDTENGSIVVIDAAQGEFEMTVRASVSAPLDFAVAYLDILAIPEWAPDDPEVIAEGIVRLNRGSTRL